MRILHISPSYRPAYVYGGPTVSVSRLCESQAAEGATIHVFTTTANGTEELQVPIGKRQVIEGVQVWYFRRWTKDHTHFSPALLWKVFRYSRHYDRVHIHSWWNFVAVFAVLMCWLRGVRPVLSTRGMLSRYSFEQQHRGAKKWLHRLLGNWLLSKTVLHGTTRKEIEEAQLIRPNWPHFIAPNIVPLPPISAIPDRPRRKDGPLQLVYLSRIHPVKGLELLFEALAKVSFPWSLNLIGVGDEDYISSLKQLAAQLQFNDRLTWCGWVSGMAKLEYLYKADLFVLTSQTENFSNAVLEALAAGTPVLVSDQVGMADYVQTAKMGWVCSLNAGSIKDNLEKIYTLTDPDIPGRLEMARQIRSAFAPKTVAQDYLNAYQTI
ncbi:MAG: glycosyltransferase [Phaeodactylibacter sp.]|nr:glycosyltransferase [Phaeodactylibacter sp.]